MRWNQYHEQWVGKEYKGGDHGLSESTILVLARRMRNSASTEGNHMPSEHTLAGNKTQAHWEV